MYNNAGDWYRSAGGGRPGPSWYGVGPAPPSQASGGSRNPSQNQEGSSNTDLCGGPSTPKQSKRALARKLRKVEIREKMRNFRETGEIVAPRGMTGERLEKWMAKKQKKFQKITTQKRDTLNSELEHRLAISIDDEVEMKVAQLLDDFHAQNTFHGEVDVDVGESGDWEAATTSFQYRVQQVNPIARKLVPKAFLDRKYCDEIKSKQQRNSVYRQMLQTRAKLPAMKMEQDIIRTVEQNQVVVISGETGCGKTTQVPQVILDHCIQAGKGSMCSIVCTQPRRISAISVAQRVAQERAEPLGISVGYQVRLEGKFPRKTGSILYCTTGIVLKWVESDPLLSKLTHIVLDEVHERDLLCDFLLVILKDILKKRPDLKVILMSASLDAHRFSQYFCNSPVLTIPGFTYPVQELFLEDVLQETSFLFYAQTPVQKKGKNYSFNERIDLTVKKNMLDYERDPFLRKLTGKYAPEIIEYFRNLDEDVVNIELITVLLRHICENKPDGAVLVFLPGWGHISTLYAALSSNEYFREDAHRIIRLHSMMPIMNQKEVFVRPPPGIRKIILATNIAETSITIDDVVYVIDTGKVKVKNFDVALNLQTLKPEWVSRASAQQRKGRAGRVQPGVCYHLFSSFRHEKLAPYQLPEILRTRLEEMCLQIKLMKFGKIGPFLERCLDVPNPKTIKLSVEFLQTLNALDAYENLTPLGYHLARLPVDPQTGKLILFGAIFSCLDPVLSVAATLGFKSAFETTEGKRDEIQKCRQLLAQDSMSDHVMMVNILHGWEEASSDDEQRKYCKHFNLCTQTLRMLKNMKQQFMKFLRILNFVKVDNSRVADLNQNSHNEKLVKAVVCAGLYPNVAKVKLRKKKQKYKFVLVRTKRDCGVHIHQKSVNRDVRNFPSPWLIFHQKMKMDNKVFLFDCTMIPPYPLLLFGGNLTVAEEGDHAAIVVDNWIRFWCSKNMSKLLMDLRRELDCFLERKVTNPGPTLWGQNSNESLLLQAIVELVDSEKILTNKVLGESGKFETEPGTLQEAFEQRLGQLGEEADQFEEDAEDADDGEAEQFEEKSEFFDENADYFNEEAGYFDEETGQFDEGGDSKEMADFYMDASHNEEEEKTSKDFEEMAKRFEEEARRLEQEAVCFEEEARLFEQQTSLPVIKMM